MFEHGKRAYDNDKLASRCLHEHDLSDEHRHGNKREGRRHPHRIPRGNPSVAFEDAQASQTR